MKTSPMPFLWRTRFCAIASIQKTINAIESAPSRKLVQRPLYALWPHRHGTDGFFPHLGAKVNSKEFIFDVIL